MSAAKTKLSIIIPLFNEEGTIATLLDQVLAVSLPEVEKEIIIVESGSTDRTKEIVRGYEGRPGVRVIYDPAPLGKGVAVRHGLEKATGDLVLIQDGDLEYDVTDYPKLLKPLMEGRCDVVFGSRILQHPESWRIRRFAGLEKVFGLFVNIGGVVYTTLFNILYGTHLTDGATMFKLFRLSDLKDIRLRSDGFDYDWEIAGKLAKKKLKFFELPVAYRPRSRAQGKKIRFWRDGTRVFLAILRFRFSD